ncbi:hypothetical protein F4776DRAFT_291800 [Hypoxylon sp. NC0597]|nr:hypothetical protein F4776DRAFT_291800 [Hypoxylon sp. NC0597]
MSPKKSASDNNDLTGQASEEDRQRIDEEIHDHYYVDNYTEDRPPNLNNVNFPSTQPGGSYSQPRQGTSVNTLPETILDTMHVTNDIDGNYTYKQYVPSTVQTDSTMRAGNPFTPRAELAYYINRDYQCHAGTGQPLTRQAMAVHDSNQTQSYGGDLYNWNPPQVGHNLSPADPGNDWSTSYMKPAGPMSETETANSWVFPPNPEDHSADIIYAGNWQPDIPAHTNTAWASYLPDEDMRDA